VAEARAEPVMPEVATVDIDMEDLPETLEDAEDAAEDPEEDPTAPGLVLLSEVSM
jgi:hypothetical protein